MKTRNANRVLLTAVMALVLGALLAVSSFAIGLTEDGHLAGLVTGKTYTASSYDIIAGTAGTAQPVDKNTDFDRIYDALSSMPMPRIRLEPPCFKLVPLKRAMLPREAWFAESETVSVDECEGRICSRARTVCPPCVPVAVGGEIFDKESIKILKMYSIWEVNVVK